MAKWRQIEDWPYDVSAQGEVRRRGGNILCPWKSNQGYPVVKFNDRGRRARFLVHKLVAHAFLGPRPAGEEIHHKNHDRTDTRAVNLAYVTHGENMRIASASGRLNPPRGETHSNARLKEAQINAIRKIVAEGRLTQGEIASLCNIPRSHVSNIINNKTWRRT